LGQRQRPRQHRGSGTGSCELRPTLEAGIDPGSVGVPDARDLQLDKVGMMTDEHDVLRAVGVRSYGRRNKLSSIITSAAKALGRNTPRS
jgi:hypothetical protein